jgi:polyferredoxin
MRNKSSAAVSVLFLLTGLFGIIASAGFRYWESLTLPIVTSSLIVILASVQLKRDLKKQTGKESNERNNTNQNDSRNRDETKRGVVFISWSVAFVLATYIFGFYIAIPAFSLAYLKRNSRSWLTSIVFAVIFLTIIYLIFDMLLNSPLYKGLIFDLL